MPKCKVCGYRLGDGVTKCPMCGAEAGSTVAGEVSPDLNLPKYTCPACNAQLIGEHRYCTSCGADLKKAAETLQTRQNTQENKCIQCGAILPVGSKFCNECGARQNMQTQANVTGKTAANPNVTVSRLKETPMEAFKYEVVDGKYILTRLKDTSLTEVVIPRIFSEIGGCIEKAQFDYCMGTWKIAKEGSEQMLGAFCGCENLTCVIIPNTIA